MSDKRKILKAGIGYTVGNYLIKGLSFFTVFIFARIMTVDDFGLYNTFIAYEGILCIIVGFAINGSYKNARYKYGLISEGISQGKDYATYVSNTMVLLVASLVVWLCVGNLLEPLFYIWLDLDRLAINCLVIYSFSTAVILCFNVNASLQYKYQSFLKVSGINAITNIILSVVLILLIFPKNGYVGRMIGTTVPVFVLALIIVVSFIKVAKPQNIREMLSWGLKYSIPIMPHGIGQIILSQFDRIMIKKMISASAAGIYSFAYTVFSIIQITANSLDNVWSPWFYEKMNENNRDEIKTKSSSYIILMTVFIVCVMLGSPELIYIMGGEKYKSAVYCVIPIVAGGYFTFLSFFPIGVEYYKERTKSIAYATFFSAVLNIVLNYIFFKLGYGYVVAAYTTLFTYIVNFLFHYWMAYKIIGKSLFSTKIISICAILILISSGGAIILLKFWILRWLILLAFAILTLRYVDKKTDIIAKIVMKFR